MEKPKKFAEDVIEWLIYFSIVLVPLIFLPFINSIFAFPKLYVLRVATAFVVIIWIIRFVMTKKNTFHFHKIFWFFIAYAAVSILTTITSVNIWSSLIGTYGRFIGLLTILNLLFWVYIVYVEINSREKIIKMLYCMVMTAFFVAIYGILQHQHILNGYNWSQDPTERMFSTIGHSNHLAAYLGMNLMLLIGLLISNKNKISRIMLSVFGVIIIAAMFLTASRGGLGATALAFMFWVICCLWSKKTRSALKKSWKIIAGIIVATVVCVIVFWGPISNLGVIQRTTSTIEFVEEGNVPDRISFWLSSWEMIKDKPILGHGLSTFRDMYNQYRRADYVLPEGNQDTVTPHTAHNEYLNIWATQGTLGIVTYLLMIASLYFYVNRFVRKTKDRKDKILINAILTGITVYLLQVFVSFGVIVTFFMLTTFSGLIISYITLKDDNKEFRAPIGAKIIISIIVVIVMGYGFIDSVRFLCGEFYFKQAQIFESNHDFQNAVSDYKSAIDFNPYFAEYYEEYADLLFRTALKMPVGEQEVYLKDSLELYQTATSYYYNYPYLHANLGLVYSRLAEVAVDEDMKNNFQIEAHEQYQIATNLSRYNPLYMYKFGKFLMYYGDTTGALEQFNNVLAIRTPYKDTKILIDQLNSST